MTPCFLFGPVAGVKVSVSEVAYPGGVDYTDEDGKYSFTYYLPTCPLGGFEFTTDVYAGLKYQNFRPIEAPAIPYFLCRQDWDHCYASEKPMGSRKPMGSGLAFCMI